MTIDNKRNSFKTRTSENLIFHERVIRSAENQPSVLSITDSSGWKLTNAEFVHRSNVLAKKIECKTGGTEAIGLLLPTSCSAAVATLAVLTIAKIPVFLNYTSSVESVNHAIEKSQIRLIISSRQFINTLRFSVNSEFLFIEDVFESKSARNISGTEDVNISRASELRNKDRVLPGAGDSLDSTATIVFSSGSTGTPKGVILSHNNLNSNINSVIGALKVQEDDVILGSLPFFHSFGFLATFWLPLYYSIPVVYHSNPMDAGKIGELVAAHGCSILFATPTFLQSYVRKCSAIQFKSLRLVITGAEKLPRKTAELFFDKFGIMPVEGYGCTELSPVVSINVPETLEDMGTKCGKPGSVGKAIPDVEVKIIDPETKEELGPNQEGLLLVRGPNVMQGYLGEPEKTDEVLQDGWYNTGDIARIDGEGYVYITGRYSRFSKIAGEMVPHGGVEEEIHKVLGVSETRVIVTGVPDTRKGERLIVLHLPIKKTPRQIVDNLRKDGLANLWIPKSRDFFQIEEIPLLGTGKLDLKRVNETAIKLAT